MRRQGESRTGTKSEITGRNRNQSTRALADTDPSATATPQNRLIPMNHAHYDNQPPSSHPPEPPESWTKPEKESRKPIQSTSVPLDTGQHLDHRSRFHHEPWNSNNPRTLDRPITSMPTTLRTESQTKPENESRKQIQFTQVPTVMYPSTTTAPKTRSIPTIRQQTRNEPPEHQPSNRQNR